MKKTFTFLMLSLVSISMVKGQHNPPDMLNCPADDEMKEFYKNNPEAEKERQQFEIEYQKVLKMSPEELKAMLPNRKSPGAAAYTIPVVFHIYGTTQNGKPVTDLIVEGALQDVNNDFNGITADYNQVTALFSGIKSTLDIDFCLAKKDPDGNPTTGIIYHPVASGYGNGGSNLGGDGWDNYKYMNVYIMADLYGDGGCCNSGVAWYPSTSMSNSNTARVVYNGAYLGNNTSTNFRSVLTHEFGHWLNLAHTFNNGCNSPGDNVADTPYDNTNGGCGPQTSCTEVENSENFMDYTDCYRMFTQGQVARMITALNHNARNTLWTQSNLLATGCQTVVPTVVPTADFSEPCVIYTGEPVTYMEQSTEYPVSWAWTFTGASNASSIDQNPTVTYSTAGQYTVTLVATNVVGASAPKTITVDIYDKPSGCVWSEDFESLSTGSLSGGWSESTSVPFTVEAGVTFSFDPLGNGNIVNFNSTGYNSTNALSAGENWVGSGPESQRVISPAIDLTGVSGAVLSFADLRRWDDAWPSDKPIHQITVAASNSASGPWTELGKADYPKTSYEAYVESQSYDLCDFDGQSNVYLSFEDNTHHFYWRIDDICISGVFGNGVTEEEIIDRAMVYPNPASGVYNLRLDLSSAGNYNVKIVNMIGAKVMETSVIGNKGTNTYAIDITDQAKGVYFLKVVGHNTEKVIKLIKE